jgi:hypothetical protein
MSEDGARLNPQQRRLLEGLYKFYRDGQLTDVTLVVEGQLFACNRNILAASSPFFRYISFILCLRVLLISFAKK